MLCGSVRSFHVPSFWLWLLLPGLLLGCRPSSASGDASADAPPPIVTEATTGMMLTWIDDKGEFHREQKVSDVPPEARELVRVVDPTREALPDTVFVADLRNVGANGRYAVRSVPRDDFENVAVERRKKKGAVLAAAPPASGAPGAPSASGSGGFDVTRPLVIIYGASWCGPCHQAEAYLKSKGVPFVEKDIEKEPGAAGEMQAKLAKVGRGGGSIPVLDVRGRILVGFDPRAVDRALGQPL
jgi:glutaredoxin